jgi:indolepyruvate ferredoxin oxidoreductase
MWYGKGPGVDRCGDVFKHANAAGTLEARRRAGAGRRRPRGQVLDAGAPDRARMFQGGDDAGAGTRPACRRYLDLGLHGWAMSRYSGCWVGLQGVADTVESSASVYVDPQRVEIVRARRLPAARRAA